MSSVILSLQGVQCIIQSSDPEKTATEIGKRLLSRCEAHDFNTLITILDCGVLLTE